MEKSWAIAWACGAQAMDQCLDRDQVDGALSGIVATSCAVSALYAASLPLAGFVTGWLGIFRVARRAKLEKIRALLSMML